MQKIEKKKRGREKMKWPPSRIKTKREEGEGTRRGQIILENL